MGDISLEEKVRPNELIEGPILPALLKFCGPVLVALFLQSLYGAVDLMVVGRFGDAASVSGVQVSDEKNTPPFSVSKMKEKQRIPSEWRVGT